MYKKYLKRVIDFFISLCLLILLAPLLILISIILVLQNRGKTPFFFQDRPGKGQQKIRIVKFKSMTDERDKTGKLLPDKERITKIGGFIRKSSIDEIPQLFNVLLGDMSLIGPRPLLFKYLPLYSKEQSRRHNVRPGITGWAQVNGRNNISWMKKFQLDVYYIDHISFALDMKILWMTLLKVSKKEGVNQSDERPMEPFDGTN